MLYDLLWCFETITANDAMMRCRAITVRGINARMMWTNVLTQYNALIECTWAHGACVWLFTWSKLSKKQQLYLINISRYISIQLVDLPVWIRSCLRNVPPSAKAFQQNRHPYGRSPKQIKCTFWIFRLDMKTMMPSHFTCVYSHMDLLWATRPESFATFAAWKLTPRDICMWMAMIHQAAAIGEYITANVALHRFIAMRLHVPSQTCFIVKIFATIDARMLLLFGMIPCMLQ